VVAPTHEGRGGEASRGKARDPFRGWKGLTRIPGFRSTLGGPAALSGARGWGPAGLAGIGPASSSAVTREDVLEMEGPPTVALSPP